MQSLEAKLHVEQLHSEGNNIGMWAEWSRARRLQESLKMAQMGLESAQNELVLLQSQSESFNEVIEKLNSLSLNL